MQALTVRTETISKDNNFVKAEEELTLRIRELEIAQKALAEAEERMNFLVTKALKKKSLKWLNGEIVYVSNVGRLYCHINDDFFFIPSPEHAEIKNEEFN